MEAIRWENGRLLLLDQTRLPFEVEYLTCTRHQDVAEAIRRLSVRGAPAIGVAAAYGVVLGAQEFLAGEASESLLDGEARPHLTAHMEKVMADLRSTRPTAVNLFWALERMHGVLQSVLQAPDPLPCGAVYGALLDAARSLQEADVQINRQIGRWGDRVIPQSARILTHCNTGDLATAGFGTALGVIRTARQNGKAVSVWVDETRPLLQGARLTAWELLQDHIPATLITDNMAGYLMQQGKVDLVLFGADRIAANGDVANKIGSYSLAVLAWAHGIPVYSAAPLSTIDAKLASGAEIPIEERSHDEVRQVRGTPVAPAEIPVYNPAFDVTPARYLTGIITEAGILRPPFRESIAAALAGR